MTTTFLHHLSPRKVGSISIRTTTAATCTTSSHTTITTTTTDTDTCTGCSQHACQLSQLIHRQLDNTRAVGVMRCGETRYTHERSLVWQVWGCFAAVRRVVLGGTGSMGMVCHGDRSSRCCGHSGTEPTGGTAILLLLLLLILV